jgi:hypothetical protein
MVKNPSDRGEWPSAVAGVISPLVTALLLAALVGCTHFEGYPGHSLTRPPVMPDFLIETPYTKVTVLRIEPAVVVLPVPGDPQAGGPPTRIDPPAPPSGPTRSVTVTPALTAAATPHTDPLTASHPAAAATSQQVEAAARELAEGRARILVFPAGPAGPARPAPLPARRPALAAATPASAARPAGGVVKAPARPASASAAPGRTHARRQSARPTELVFEQPPPLRLATPSAPRSN